jgi:diguanylate cyclase (GGDEF)-like protein
MRAAMQRKSVVRQRPTEDLNAQVLRLSRQNAALRREVAKLQVFRSMAYRDPLTGLWNRRYFEERLAEEKSRSERAGSGRRFSVLVIDINDFKRINDEHGHPVGDELLKWAGEFLETHLRTHDVACRTGGDEFSVLLPDTTSEDVARLITRLRELLAVANRSRVARLGLDDGGRHRARRRRDVRRQAPPKSRRRHGAGGQRPRHGDGGAPARPREQSEGRESRRDPRAPSDAAPRSDRLTVSRRSRGAPWVSRRPARRRSTARGKALLETR